MTLGRLIPCDFTPVFKVTVQPGPGQGDEVHWDLHRKLGPQRATLSAEGVNWTPQSGDILSKLGETVLSGTW